MNRRYYKIILVWTFSLFLMFVPTAKAIGFGTDASGLDVFSVQAMLKSMGYYAQTTPRIPGLSAEEEQMVDLVNQARRDAGLNPLSADIPLANVARLKSKDMVDNNYFSHQSPTYGSPFEMMQKFGISFRSAAENIACNQDVSAAHVALMNSPGHRTNLLNPEYTVIGIGIAEGGACGKMFTEDFISR